MTIMSSEVGRHLGLNTIWQDYRDTWSNRGGSDRHADRRRSALWYFGVPTAAAAVFAVVHVQLQAVAQLIAGVALLTGLLFGLLVLMFNTAIALKKDGPLLENAHGVGNIISDLRATVTYTVLVALVVVLVLMMGAVASSPTGGLPWGWTPFVVWLFVHLGLNMLSILQSFRTAFNYLMR